MLAKGIPNRGTLQDSNLQELYGWATNKSCLMLRDVTTISRCRG
jgi:hypothetical protein